MNIQRNISAHFRLLAFVYIFLYGDAAFADAFEKTVLSDIESNQVLSAVERFYKDNKKQAECIPISEIDYSLLRKNYEPFFLNDSSGKKTKIVAIQFSDSTMGICDPEKSKFELTLYYNFDTKNVTTRLQDYDGMIFSPFPPFYRSRFPTKPRARPSICSPSTGKCRAHATVRLALEGLECLSQGKTNECIQLLSLPEYDLLFDKGNLDAYAKSDFGKMNLKEMLILDVFSHAIPDIMVNPLTCAFPPPNDNGAPLPYQALDESDIQIFAEVLCKRDLLTGLIEDLQNDTSEISMQYIPILSDAYWAYMEMSVLRYVNPQCDISEFEKRIDEAFTKAPKEERTSE